MISIFLTVLLGCSDSGSGEVTTASDAPWDMNGAASFLFTPDPDNDGRSGKGTLAISTDAKHDCGAVRDGPPAGASGLLFSLEYFTGRSTGAASPSWDGLYAAGIASAVGSSAYRGLTVGGWHSGFEYSFEGTDAWVDVADGSKDKFVGTFSTEWWTGQFNAKVCEDSASDEGADDTGELN